VENTFHIFIGVNALDYSGYPDCRPEYIESFQKMARLATKSGVEETEQLIIHTPLIDLKKSEIIKLGIELGVDYSKTHSCYDPLAKDEPCGKCDACILRIKGFLDAGTSDPLNYPDI
jgi:7-cyano-7-deazaguanine synthase